MPIHKFVLGLHDLLSRRGFAPQRGCKHGDAEVQGRRSLVPFQKRFTCSRSVFTRLHGRALAVAPKNMGEDIYACRFAPDEHKSWQFDLSRVSPHSSDAPAEPRAVRPTCAHIAADYATSCYGKTRPLGAACRNRSCRMQSHADGVWIMFTCSAFGIIFAMMLICGYRCAPCSGSRCSFFLHVILHPAAHLPS